MKRKKLEKVEEDKFSRRVKAHGWECIKLSTTGFYGESGFNDRLVFAEYGVSALFEFKRDGEEAEPLQKYRHRKLKKLGHHSYVVYRSDAAFEILAKLIAEAHRAFVIHQALSGGEEISSLRAEHRRDEEARKARRRKAKAVPIRVRRVRR